MSKLKAKVKRKKVVSKKKQERKDALESKRKEILKFPKLPGERNRDAHVPRIYTHDDYPRQSDHWKLSEYGLSVSGMLKWVACMEQFRLAYVEGLRGDGFSAAIDFGQLWHGMLENRANGEPIDLIPYLRAQYAKIREEHPNSPTKRFDQFNLSCLKTQALWPEYLKRYEGEESIWKWQAAEEKFNVEIDVPGCKYPIPFHGIFDGVYLHGGKELRLFETKTKGRIDPWEIEDAIYLDLQVMSYAYAMKAVYKRYPTAVCYNVIRNPETRHLKTESGAAYVKKLQKQVQNDPDHYFKRWHFPLSAERIERYAEMQLKPILRAIYLWAESETPHFINKAELVSKYGRSVFFDAIAASDLTGLVRKPVVANWEEK